MASLVTLGEIKTRALRRADKEGSAFIGNAELTEYVNEAYAALYSIMVSSYENYFSTQFNVNLMAGTSVYNLPADFYKLITFEYLIGGRFQTLFPYNELERNAIIATPVAIPTGTVRMRYIKPPVIFVNDTDMIDCVAGWDALLVTDVAIMILDKEESDTDRLERRRQRDFQRITEASHNRSITFPGRVSDVSVYDFGWLGQTLRWRLYGDTVEFISIEWTGM